MGKPSNQGSVLRKCKGHPCDQPERHRNQRECLRAAQYAPATDCYRSRPMLLSSSRKVARRVFLRAALLLTSLAAAPRTSSAGNAAAPGSVPELGVRDRELALLAEELLRRRPDEAARVHAGVEAALPSRRRLFAVSRRARARLARQTLLAPDRIARELDRGDVVALDGWVLARSEAHFAIYLASLEQS